MPSAEVRLYANLSRYGPGGESNFSVEIQEGDTVGRLLERLSVPPSAARIIFVDSLQRPLEHPLSGGEKIGIFPAIAGG